MKSKWFSIKEKAISLRKRGFSIGYVEKKLGISRSTLSGWFKNIELTKEQKERLLQNRKLGLISAQKKGGQWHAYQGNQRRAVIRRDIEKLFPKKVFNKKTGELIIAAFYLAEGSKKENAFSIANSNPTILKCIINLLRYLYALDESKFRCCLHLRNDQNEKKVKNYWSNLLNIPKEKFHKTQFDKRTTKKTYRYYKGVCVVYYFDIALQRRVLYLGEKLLDVVINLGG
ncbi:MAG: hypothetical protein FJZ43_02240 [Candidatus Staskawiczbacteria bacterium]|nr:hypothetical protein [Candidatus Staskawiczbacteria bacterium]